MTFSYPFAQTCFITGHRPQSIGSGWNDRSAHQICKQQLKRLLLRSLDRGYVYFIDGLAVGADLWCAELICFDPELVERGAKLIAAVPFPGQSSAWKDPDVLDLYRRVLIQAHDTYTVSLEIPIPAQTNHKQWAAIALLQRDNWMIDRASLGIGLYDGRTSGGTYHTIQYARRLERILCTYHPKLRVFERLDDRGLIAQT